MRVHGFTLVEMLAAVALTGLLMVSVLQVTASLGTTGRAWDTAANHPRTGAMPKWVTQLQTTLSREASAATRVVVESDDVLRLDGFIGRHPQTGAATHEPAIVRYRFTPHPHPPPEVAPSLSAARSVDAAVSTGSHEHGCILREEQWLLSITDAPPTVSLVASGVTSWSVQTITHTPATDSASAGEGRATVKPAASDFPAGDDASDSIELAIGVFGETQRYRVRLPVKGGAAP